MPSDAPVLQVLGQLGRGAGEHQRRPSGSTWPSSSSRSGLAGRRRSRLVVEEHDQVGEDPQRLAEAAGRPPPRRRISASMAPTPIEVVGRDEDGVGAAGGQPVRARRVGQGGDERLALRRPGRDRRAPDAEPPAPRSRCSGACRGRRSGRWRRRGSRRHPPSCPTAGARPRRSRPPRRAGRVTSAGQPGSSGSGAGEVGNRPPPELLGFEPGFPTPGPARRPGRCSRSRGWRWPWRRETARCGSSWPSG